LVTAHRRENFGAPLTAICDSLRTIAERWQDISIVFPVHPSPNVWDAVHARLAGVDRVILISAVAYEVFVALMKASDIILTDSGGIQEEAPSLQKPVLVMRETTERVEGIEAGTAQLVGTASDAIVTAVERLLCDPAAYARMAGAVNPYGDGRAAERIVAILKSECGPL
jgi:UDP-N-acetylglucosamine 2-epimerase (non-hydrolysing)